MVLNYLCAVKEALDAGIIIQRSPVSPEELYCGKHKLVPLKKQITATILESKRHSRYQIFSLSCPYSETLLNYRV